MQVAAHNKQAKRYKSNGTGKPVMFDHMKTRTLARPEIPTEHLMTDFDQFYGKVVSRQLLKDKF